MGYIFLESGWGKLHHLDKVTDFFKELGIPFANLQAPFVATVEFLGGVSLLLGIGTRISAFLLSGVMVVAIVTAKRADVTRLSDLFGMSEFLYIVIFVCLMALGSGKISLGHWLCDRACKTPSDAHKDTHSDTRRD